MDENGDGSEVVMETWAWWWMNHEGFGGGAPSGMFVQPHADPIANTTRVNPNSKLPVGQTAVCYRVALEECWLVFPSFMIDVPVDNAKKLSSAQSEAPSMVEKFRVPQHRGYATQYMRSRLRQMLGSRQWSGEW
ncbi:hypothetical protein CMUS01_14165 [Colletotrichum musicola]|uniref:Uncharacterized protein n=1 Tax=Colletotrichum musicola TaxID=2175873 RepID=A0A8H6MT57_9PEZI|nr:hypothetical protein CMUS01_14165 [Colletotrichum musicola]